MTSGQKPSTAIPQELSSAGVHPGQLDVDDWASYALVIDARSPREFGEDHIPGAVNLPVVGDEEFAEVGTRHRTDPHGAYLMGVEYSLRNIASQIKPFIAPFGPKDRFMVYCFRGGKRSRLWADNLKTIGFKVDVLPGGWKRYRAWVRESLDQLGGRFKLHVLAGPTGCGKTRLLHALSRHGQQVIDLEELARHRGSLIGALPDLTQPSQKYFDSLLLDAYRRLDPTRPVWIEAESKKIGNVQLPQSLFEAMHAAPVFHLSAPMDERVKLWREDYPHFVTDPVEMVRKLQPLKPLVGARVLTSWVELAEAGRVDELFRQVMTEHYDPCYARSTGRNYPGADIARRIALQSLEREALDTFAKRLCAEPASNG